MSFKVGGEGCLLHVFFFCCSFCSLLLAAGRRGAPCHDPSLHPLDSLSQHHSTAAHLQTGQGLMEEEVGRSYAEGRGWALCEEEGCEVEGGWIKERERGV